VNSTARSWANGYAGGGSCHHGGGNKGRRFLAASWSHIYETLGAVRNFIISATFLALVLVGFFAALMAKSFTTPIEDLTSAARQMAAGNLKQEIPVRHEDEIGQLTRQFNNMSTRVMETNRQLREFVANASHELRTPLTTINLLVIPSRIFPMIKKSGMNSSVISIRKPSVYRAWSPTCWTWPAWMERKRTIPQHETPGPGGVGAGVVRLPPPGSSARA
jgi:methyl-accepting chemotaxis protein